VGTRKRANRKRAATLAVPRGIMLRPGYIQPLRGIRSKTKFYRVFYAAVAPLYPLWEFLLPKYVTTTERVARAMLAIAKNGYPKRILENSDIKAIR
jgi:hypothetical protein